MAQQPAIEQVVAPDMNVQMWRPPIDAEATLWTNDAGRAPDNYMQARLWLDYLNGPIGAIVTNSANNNEQPVQVLEDSFMADMTLSLANGPFRAGGHIPVILTSGSDLSDVVGTGIGDATMDLKMTAINPRKEVLGVAFAGRLTFPTATVNVPLGNGGIGYEVEGILDHRIGDKALIAGNFGTKGFPEVNVGGVEIDDAFFFRTGGAVYLMDDAGITTDVGGQFSYASLADPISNPVEAIVGGFGRIDPNFMLRGGVGTGITNGLGAPVLRTLASIAYEPIRDRDQDFDGILDKVDGCPLEAEDFDKWHDEDGCPDNDNDEDGIVDKADQCPDNAEDPDGYQDDNGCPDPLTLVTILLTDKELRPIPTLQSTVRFKGEPPLERSGGSEFEVELQPGLWTLTGVHPSYQKLTEEIKVPEGAPYEVARVMKTLVTQWPVRVRIVNLKDEPLQGTVRYLTAAPLPVPVDGTDLMLGKGSFDLIAEAEGYDSKTMSVTIEPDGDKPLATFKLQPAFGFVTLKVVDPAGKKVKGSRFRIDNDETTTDVIDEPMKVRNGNHTLIVSAEGYQPAALDIVSIPGEVIPLEVILKPARVAITGKQIKIADKVYFDTGKATIKKSSNQLLDEIVELLRNHPELLSIRIEGHTDSRGSDKNNQILSEARAKAVRVYLQSKGIAKERLNSVGLGESKPLDPAENATAWAKNRRVEFHIEKRAQFRDEIK